MNFEFVSKNKASDAQSQAVSSLVKGIENDFKFQTLKGITGSGKTYTMAKIIEKLNRQTLILSHNKTLSAQLYREFKEFFPKNKVEYFVSYYDYYQPEAYIPQRDIYIQKETLVNKDLEILRSAAAVSLFERKDTIVVASVSCIYGIGSPSDYLDMSIEIKEGDNFDLKNFTLNLVNLQYKRTDLSILNEFEFKMLGDIIDINTAYFDGVVRIILEFDTVDKIYFVDKNGKKEILEKVRIYPAKIFVSPANRMALAIKSIQKELEYEYKKLEKEGNMLYADRLKSKTEYDIQMLRETGFCQGIENYSRHIFQKEPNAKPYTLFDCFEKDFLMFVDESHVALPQVRGMYNGDKARKQVLVDYGFRLPSAFDNRPLKFDEFENSINQCIFVSATPGDFELENSKNIAYQIIRPTGLLDPKISVYKSQIQMEKIYSEVISRIAKNERCIILTITKKMAEHLADYLEELGIKSKYLHSEIDTIDRVKILKELREGVFDVIIGINLLREGIDLPEVSLVIILDADKMGFLRSKNSLIQIIGRSARHVNGQVIMFCDKVTKHMQDAIDETNQRRAIQEKYNQEHSITPKSIIKEIKDIIEINEKKIENDVGLLVKSIEKKYNMASKKAKKDFVKELEKLMKSYAADENFEKAIKIRDIIKDYEKK